MGDSQPRANNETLPSVDDAFATTTSETPEVLGFAIAWSSSEPERIADITLFPEMNRQCFIGRGTDDHEERAQFVRPGPRERGTEEPLDGISLSRRQLAVRPVSAGLEFEQVGQCPTRVNGRMTQSGVLRPGDTVMLGSELLLLCIKRRARLTLPSITDSPHPFGQPDADGILGESEVTWRHRDELARIARLDAHVLVYGEIGAGKELAVNAIHRLSNRAGGPLRVSTAYSGDLASRELFGDVADYGGSGLPERRGQVDGAEHGFFFLDAAQAFPKEIDEQLVRLADHGEYRRAGGSDIRRADVRLIVTSYLRPSQLRDQLFQRLTPVRVPPLRERREDIPLLVRHFLRQCMDLPFKDRPDMVRECAEGSQELKVHRRLIDYLLHHPLDGNVRELGGIVRDAAVRSVHEDSVRLPRHLESATPGVYDVQYGMN